MKNLCQTLGIIVGFAMLFGMFCERNTVFNSDSLAPVDTMGSLQTVAEGFPVGIGIDANLMLNNTQYSNLVRQQFEQITLEYNMKQGAIVQDNGTFDYSTADQVVQMATDANMSIHGHTLVWYQNNNGTYLRSLVDSGPVGQDSTNVANFLQDYITSTVDHFEGQVISWDVVNEPVQDGTGEIRTNPSPGTPTDDDIFYWAEFLGEGYIPLAFEYANKADPEANLYLNDYNLESDPSKLEAFVNLANQLVENEVPIDGVGTQMHISINTSYAGIDRAFKQLASTGLKVKVTELDVKINPDNLSTFTLTDQLLAYQQIMYNYVAWSYIQNVPQDQRAGISVWNLKDDTSWIVTTQNRIDYPTLFDSTFAKKPAYSGFKKGLTGAAPNSE